LNFLSLILLLGLGTGVASTQGDTAQ